MAVDSVQFKTERALVEAITDELSAESSPWPNLSLTREFSYTGGRTDILAVDQQGRVIAFEAKLDRWRVALHQAYRNTAFAHFSYIVLPLPAASRAARSFAEFARHAVGLCAASPQGLQILIEAPYSEPVLPGLTALAAIAPGSPQ